MKNLKQKIFLKNLKQKIFQKCSQFGKRLRTKPLTQSIPVKSESDCK